MFDPATISTIGGAVKDLMQNPATGDMTETERATFIIVSALITLLPSNKVSEFVGHWKANVNQTLKDPKELAALRALGT